MRKFLSQNVVIGHSQKMRIKNVQLILPKAKNFLVHAVKDGEDVLREETLIEDACNRKTSEVDHIGPYVIEDGQVPFSHYPKTLQHILSKSTYPLSQGPVLLPNECFTLRTM